MFFLVFIIGDTVDTAQQGNGFEVESLLAIVPLVVALVGYILAWWHKFIGGTILILVSIAYGIEMVVAANNNLESNPDFHALQGWLILGLPFLVTGGLFLISGWLGRKAPS